MHGPYYKVASGGPLQTPSKSHVSLLMNCAIVDQQTLHSTHIHLLTSDLYYSVPGGQIISGAQRVHDCELLAKRAEACGTKVRPAKYTSSLLGNPICHHCSLEIGRFLLQLLLKSLRFSAWSAS